MRLGLGVRKDKPLKNCDMFDEFMSNHAWAQGGGLGSPPEVVHRDWGSPKRPQPGRGKNWRPYRDTQKVNVKIKF